MALSSTEVSRLPSKNSMMGKNWGDSLLYVFLLAAAAGASAHDMSKKIQKTLRSRTSSTTEDLHGTKIEEGAKRGPYEKVIF